MDERIVIDKGTLKALSVDSRLTILKLLALRQHTLSELASELGLAQSTIKGHLDVLQHAELIVLIDDGRKWKYYKLTKKGRNVVDPHETKVMFVFVASLIAAIGAGIAILRNAVTSQPAPLAQRTATPEAALFATSEAADTAIAVNTAAQTVPTVPAVILIIAGALLIASFLYVVYRRRQLRQQVKP